MLGGSDGIVSFRRLDGKVEGGRRLTDESGSHVGGFWRSLALVAPQNDSPSSDPRHVDGLDTFLWYPAQSERRNKCHTFTGSDQRQRIAPIAARVIATQLPSDADAPPAPSMSATRISELAQERGLRAIAVDHPADAIGMALRTGDGPIVVAGSFLHLAAADRYVATMNSRPQIVRRRHPHATRLV